jgi:hypothetical protein
MTRTWRELSQGQQLWERVQGLALVSEQGQELAPLFSQVRLVLPPFQEPEPPSSREPQGQISWQERQASRPWPGLQLF